MKPLSQGDQLGLASPLKYAAIQSGKTKSPSSKEAGLDASYQPRVPSRGTVKNFFLTSSLIGTFVLVVILARTQVGTRRGASEGQALETFIPRSKAVKLGWAMRWLHRPLKERHSSGFSER
jgi:hypothetical protein